ncbi:MAG: CHASE domain-containing protein [Magnetococcales bacterium]|nr:CHASE domain-containing protein [Magnetococcales bacterium]
MDNDKILSRSITQWYQLFSPILLVAFFGSVISFAGSWYLHNDIQSWTKREFDWLAQRRLEVLQNGINHHIAMVEDIRSLFTATKTVTDLEFQIFVHPFLSSHDGIQAFEWIPRVKAAERARFEYDAQIRVPNFQIKEKSPKGDMVPAKPRLEYFPVFYLEPYFGNEAAMGYDIASEPARLIALNKARDTGKLVASQRVVLVQEKEKKFGVLVYFPIYRHGAPTDTVSQRREHLRGFVIGVFRVADLIESIIESHMIPSGVDFLIEDKSINKSESFLYVHKSRADGSLPPIFEAQQDLAKNDSIWRGTLQIANRDWSFTAAKNRALDVQITGYPKSPWIFLVVGLLLTILLVVIMLRKKSYLEDLEKKESRYQKLFAGMGSAVAVYEAVDGGEDFVFRDFNPASERVSKTKKEDVLGRKVTDAFPDVKRFGIFEVFQRVYKTGKPERHPVSQYNDDRIAIWVENYVYKLPSGEVVAIYDDVTTQKNAEAALLKSENHLRTLLESLPQKIFLKNTKSVYISCNQHYAADLGIKPDEISGKTDFDFHPHALAEKYRNDDKEIVEKGIIKDVEESYLHNNKELTVQTVKSPVRNDDGKIIGILGIFWDITARKQGEESIRNLNIELEERVRDRTIELESANKALESFLYTVAHDMRAPLRTLDGFSSILMEEYGDKLDDDGINYLKSLQDGGKDMHRLIEGLLALSRSMKSKLTRKTVDLSQVANDVVQALVDESDNREVTSKITPAIAAYGDANFLKLLLENLFSNAWKFTANSTQALIEFTSYTKDGETVYVVRDNGAGFDMDHKDLLFRPFYQLHKPGEYKGSGVGLALAQRVVERHGGQIWAESEVGKGAKFYFTLGKVKES